MINTWLDSDAATKTVISLLTYLYRCIKLPDFCAKWLKNNHLTPVAQIV